MPRTLFDKVWDAHVVVPETPEHPAVLYVDLHLLHEVTSPQAFDVLRARGLSVRRPERCLATLDHSTPTTPREGSSWPGMDPQADAQIRAWGHNTRAARIRAYGVGDAGRGIVHVIGPELGATQPGMTIVCGDSHTATHGAFGALAFGIGTTEVGHALATQCLLQRRPRTMAVRLEGAPGEGTEAKDLVLAVLARLGTEGGSGHVLEYVGAAVTALDMEGRMTLCNMSIEGGARAGMIAPDAVTFESIRGREDAPAEFDARIDRWLGLASDPGAPFDGELVVDVDGLEPQVTWGTTPSMASAITDAVPEPRGPDEARAQDYMGVSAGETLAGQAVDEVFVGSCTNGRLGDLRRAAEVLRGRRVASSVRMLVVPGSERVKAAAEAEGLDRVFVQAGAEWREPGCSMCIAMNGDRVGPGRRAVSTSNRNFRGRQGPGSRTFLAGAATAAASAAAGCLADPREVHRG